MIIPTASEYADSTELEARMQLQFNSYGVLDVRFFHTRSRQTADDPQFVKPLLDATGVWLGGGVQQRLADAYLGTAVEKALHAVLERGGVIGGTSSGAAVMSRLMIREGKTVAQTGTGFGFVIGAVVDQLSLDLVARPRLFPVMGGAVYRGYSGTGFRSPPFALGRFAWGGERIQLARLEVPARLLGERLTLVALGGNRSTP